MKFLSATALMLAFFGAAHSDDLGQAIPSPVIGDPAPDPVHPPRSAQVLVPSHGLGMNAFFISQAARDYIRPLCDERASRYVGDLQSRRFPRGG
jgi:hypothetical protein